jgi:hypothetical protein
MKYDPHKNRQVLIFVFIVYYFEINLCLQAI